MLPPSAVDGRSRNPLYYYYYSDILEKKISNQSDILAVILSDRFSTVRECGFYFQFTIPSVSDGRQVSTEEGTFKLNTSLRTQFPTVGVARNSPCRTTGQGFCSCPR